MGPTLREHLIDEPPPLRFGTSGRRGLVAHLTQLEVYLNALAELEYLLALPAAEGGIRAGEEFYFGYDLRPSSTQYVAEQAGRGELAQAIERAIRDAGLRPVNLGALPTPAVTCFALARGRGSMMITGSHIPFDRNGYKTNTACGELRKRDEAPINERVERVRDRLYRQPFAASRFDAHGRFKAGHGELGPVDPAGHAHYVRRYVEFGGDRPLAGLRLLAYQHSAVGRDLLVEILTALGATVFPAGRSDQFVPIDTENIDAAQLAAIQVLVDTTWGEHGPFDAVVSTDGDSDRPLLLGLEPGNPGRVRFFGGDVLGMIVAGYLQADAVVVPITCNDGIDQGPLHGVLEPKTKIGSPHVIAGMEAARRRGCRRVCGWEANGGFLTGTDIERQGRVLSALPTRDAMLPLVAVLGAMVERRCRLTELFAALPRRFSRAALRRNFPRVTSQRLLARFTPPAPDTIEVVFEPARTVLRDAAGQELSTTAAMTARLCAQRDELLAVFGKDEGFGRLVRVNCLDGLRLWFDNGDVAHVRPSGNADELRIYAVADTPERAEAIVARGIAEPDGLLSRLQAIAVSEPR